MDKCEKKISR